jgi:hypothetical protein
MWIILPLPSLQNLAGQTLMHLWQFVHFSSSTLMTGGKDKTLFPDIGVPAFLPYGFYFAHEIAQLGKKLDGGRPCALASPAPDCDTNHNDPAGT